MLALHLLPVVVWVLQACANLGLKVEQAFSAASLTLPADEDV